jgi:phosphate/sulfate permease
MRALYFAPFFYALIGGVLVVFLAYKIPATSSVAGTQSGGIATLANVPDQLTAASCITAAVTFVLSAVYVSYWQYRYNWVGEDLRFVEWFYFFVLPKRPIREGFVPPTLEEEAGAAVSAEKTLKVPEEGVTALENPSTEVPGSDSAPADAPAPTKAPETKFASLTDLEVDAQHKYDMADVKAGGVLALLAAAPAPNLLLAEVTAKPVPAVIKAAMDVATEEGYVIRPMEESELVRAAWAKDLKEQGVMGMLYMPFKFLTFGIFGPDGGDRTVRAYKADTEEIKALHATAFRYDDRTELVFRQLQMITSLIASFAHGSNDVANAMGPFSAILGVYWCNIQTSGSTAGQCLGDPLPNTAGNKPASAANGWATPDWLLAVGGIMIGLGFTVYGYHLMRSLGNNLTYHSPSRGYCMEFGAAVTVLLASRIGLPISTTQAITGATIAIGLLNGLRGINWMKFATIFASWCITMPIVGIYAGLIFAFIAGSPSLRNPAAA